MDLQTALHFAWIVWIALILIFLVVEVFTLDMTFLMLGIGSIGGLLSSLFGAPIWAQFVIAVVLSLLLIFLLRPRLLRALRRGGDPTPSNVEALLGLSATVTRAFVDGAGTAKLANGETWTARVAPVAADFPLAIGDRVTVVAIEGATAVVEPDVALPGLSPERTVS
jgi:membrane protein implicated in regulation of membrane protease activity